MKSLGISMVDKRERESIAWKETVKKYPNYGKAVDMGAYMWWNEVITRTFQPHHQHSPIPPALTETLINRFWSKEGYTLFPDAEAYIRKLTRQRFSFFSQSSSSSSSPSTLTLPSEKEKEKEKGKAKVSQQVGRLVVGVITNSDDRIPDVLASLGLSVSTRRFEQQTPSLQSPSPSPQYAAPPSSRSSSSNKQATHVRERNDNDIDFCIMSYHVGHEKPDARIFDAATRTLQHMMLEQETAQNTTPAFDLQDWHLLYVGDEVEKDVRGAIKAGWDAVIIHRGHEQRDSAYEGDAPTVQGTMQVEGSKVTIISDFEALAKYEGHHPLLDVS
jgi:FMN phosphatase YigB (HAD superfamily)